MLLFWFLLVGIIYSKEWHKVKCNIGIPVDTPNGSTTLMIYKTDDISCSCGDNCVETRYYTTIQVMMDEDDGNLNQRSMYHYEDKCSSGEDEKDDADDWLAGFQPNQQVTCYVSGDYVSYKKPDSELGLILGLSLGLGLPVLCLVCLPCIIFCCLFSTVLFIIWIIICVVVIIVIVIVIVICIIIVIIIVIIVAIVFIVIILLPIIIPVIIIVAIISIIILVVYKTKPIITTQYDSYKTNKEQKQEQKAKEKADEKAYYDREHHFNLNDEQYQCDEQDQCDESNSDLILSYNSSTSDSE